jgi:hypothetical protein
MEINFYAILVAALAPLVVGFIWYSPLLFGKAWMKETNLTDEELKKGSMLKIFGLTFLFSVMFAMVIQMLCVHQFGPLGMIGGPDFIETAKPSYAAFMADYGTAFRTAKHGALHGLMTGLFLALPMMAINGLFERKSWKYIFIHAGFWTVSMTIMGAIICGWI